MNNRIASIDEILGDRKDILHNLENARDKAMQDLKKCEEEMTEYKNAVEGYRIKVQTRTEKNEKIKAEISAVDTEIQRKQERVRILDDMEKNMEGYHGSVKAVMQEQKRGALRGIHGALSQLITVKDKYSVAVETALGTALQNVVVDTPNDAKQAIEYLKASHGGRATFLPIESIKTRTLEEKGLQDQYGFVSMASDLVSVDKKYQSIIENLLGRVAVCEDIDSAIAMAKKYNNRFKIVTLDGQVMNAGGSMTGGSKAQGVGMLSRGSEIEKLRENIKSLEEKKKMLESDAKTISEDLALAVADLNGIEGDIVSHNENKIRLEGEYNNGRAH